MGEDNTPQGDTVRRFTIRSVQGQLMTLVAAGLVGLVVLALLSAQHLSSTMLTERKAMLRSIVQEAITIAAVYEEKARSGEMTTEEAQADALVALNAQRFDPNGYLFGYTTDGTCFLLPTKTERVGENFIAEVDAQGNAFIKGIVDAGQDPEGGFTEYWFPKPDEEAASPKLAYSLSFEPWGWVIGTGAYVDDVQAAADAQLGRQLLLQVLPIVVALLVVGLYISRRVERSINGITRTLEQGDLSTRLDEGNGKTELDRLAKALNHTLDNVSQVVREVITVSGELDAAAGALDDASLAIAEKAQGASERARHGTDAADALTQSFGALVESSAQMGVAVREIARNASEATRVASDAVVVAGDANEVIRRLGLSSTEIGDVVRVINTIARQTKLLALNATIESARAGEGGKGFAVVATEVKDLAQGTTDASDDIVRRVGALVEDTEQAVTSVESIAEIISSINAFQASIAGAIEEQTATTSEIDNVVGMAAANGRVVSELMREVSENAAQTEGGLEPVRANAQRLVRASAQLKATVSVFQGADRG